LRKLLLLILLFLSGHSYPCVDEEEAQFVKDARAFKNPNDQCTTVQVLINEESSPKKRYVESVYLNILDKEKKLIAAISPELDRPSHGNILFSACLMPEYVENSVLFLNVKPKSEVQLQENGSYRVSGTLCQESQKLVLGTLIEQFGSVHGGEKQ